MSFKKYLIYFLSGALAGMFIGLGGWAYLTVGRGLIGAVVFPIGLYLICKIKADLYTGRIGFLFQEDISISYLLTVLIGNIAGAVLLGLCYTCICGPSTGLMRGIYEIGLQAGFDNLELFFRSLLCGALVYLAVFLYRTEQPEFAKFLSIFFPIFIFMLCGFRHCIADMFYIFAGREFTWQAFTTWILTFGGNSIGAIGLSCILKKIK